jgi:hypothetical protein
VEEEVGPGREGSKPLAHGLWTKGGKAPDVAVSDTALMSVDDDDDKDNDHHGRSPPQAPPSAKPWPCADDRAGVGGRRLQHQRGRRRRQRGGHVQPDRESAGPAPETADPAWRQLDLLRLNWEEKRSRRLEEEDDGGGGSAGGAARMVTIYHDVPPNN